MKARPCGISHLLKTPTFAAIAPEFYQVGFGSSGGYSLSKTHFIFTFKRVLSGFIKIAHFGLAFLIYLGVYSVRRDKAAYPPSKLELRSNS
jgi:hypothetical protein